MTIENLPHWTFLPNWRQPVNETLTWSTVILGSRTGAEQRFGVRWSPRRSFEALFTPTGVSRTHFDLAVGKVGIDPWYMPVWHDVTRLSAELSSGASSLSIDTDYREFKAGGFVMLRADEFTSEVLEIDTIAGGAIEFVDGPSQDWPEGTLVFPALKARITDQPSMTRYASRAFENALRFEVIGENDFTGAEAAETTYLSYPVLTVGPNEALDLTHAYVRLFDELDSDTGLLERVHTSDIGFTVQGHNWRALDRQQHAELRSYFYALAGRRNPTWVPTFAEDFYLALPVSSGATSITVRKCGFVAFGGPRTGRQDVEIVLKDGTAIRRRISGAAYDDQGREVINLTASIGQNIAVDEVSRISFMSLSRLDTDSIEFTHHTDNRGVSDVAATFRSAPDIRVATDWAPSLPNNTIQTAGACGDVCTPSVSAIGSAFLLTAGLPAGTAYRLEAKRVMRADNGAFVVAHTNQPPGYSWDLRALAVADDDSVTAPVSMNDTGITSGGPAGAALWADRMADGNFIFLEQDLDQGVTPADSRLRVQTFDSNGAKVGSPAVLLVRDGLPPNEAFQTARVCAAGGGGYFVSYTALVSNGTAPGVSQIRKYNSSHAEIAGPVNFDTSSSANKAVGEMWAFSSGNLLAFRGGVESGIGKIWARIFNDDLSGGATEDVIYSNATSALGMSLYTQSRGPGDTVLLCWTEDTGGGAFAQKCARFDDAGALVGSVTSLFTGSYIGFALSRYLLATQVTTSGNIVTLESEATDIGGGNYSTQMYARFYVDGEQVSEISVGEAFVTPYAMYVYGGTYGSMTELTDGTYVAAAVVPNPGGVMDDGDVGLYAQRFSIEECA